MDLDAQQMAARAPDAAAFLKLLANQNRLMILCALTEQELSVGELNKRVPWSQSALSRHVSSLRRAGLVSTRRRAQVVYYHTSDDRVRSIMVSLSALFCEVD
jgi:DNA-binding transcriptional ArsR family regulator